MYSQGTGYGANLVGIPAGLLASTAFNDFPLALHIAGVRENHALLFQQLDSCDDPMQAAGLFENYMREIFALQVRNGAVAKPGKRRFHSSYRRLLCGWGFDTNSREGAVLKAWVESRFGIFPLFHKEPLTRVPSPAWSNYLEEKLSSRFHNNNIFSQLDLLYEFCQWSLPRWHGKNRHILLFRGINDFTEAGILHKNPGDEVIMRFNNLVSFTAKRAIACEFGDYLLDVNVPKVKIVFYSELLREHSLKGESEFLVIGGDYRVHSRFL
jgi:NAD+---dinitrogen-reductase ADP-D-ribosyltransferase